MTLGFGGAQAEDAEGLVGDLGLVFPIAEHWTAGYRIAVVDVESKESGNATFGGETFAASRTTKGTGAGFGGELRFYPARALDGFWIGAGLLYFPITDFELRGEARDLATGLVLEAELEAEEIDFVPYGALGWTFRAFGRSSWGLELDVGSAAGEPFATLTLRVGLGL